MSAGNDSLIQARDLEWEVTHKKSKLHKGRGDTPEAALRDLRDGFAKGVEAAQEEIDREQKRLDKLNALLGETEPDWESLSKQAASDMPEKLDG